MSLLSLFATQRRRWFDQLAEYPADYFAGAWAALLQAEVAFKAAPFYNIHLAAQKAEAELKEANHGLHHALRQIQQLVPPHRAAKQAVKDANRSAQHDRRRVSLTRKALVRMSVVAGRDEFEPEVRLRYLQDLICSHLALLREENPDVRPQ